MINFALAQISSHLHKGRAFQASSPKLSGPVPSGSALFLPIKDRFRRQARYSASGQGPMGAAHGRRRRRDRRIPTTGGKRPAGRFWSRPGPAVPRDDGRPCPVRRRCHRDHRQTLDPGAGGAAYPEDEGLEILRLDGLQRANAGIGSDDFVVYSSVRRHEHFDQPDKVVSQTPLQNIGEFGFHSQVAQKDGELFHGFWSDYTPRSRMCQSIVPVESHTAAHEPRGMTTIVES